MNAYIHNNNKAKLNVDDTFAQTKKDKVLHVGLKCQHTSFLVCGNCGTIFKLNSNSAHNFISKPFTLF